MKTPTKKINPRFTKPMSRMVVLSLIFVVVLALAWLAQSYFSNYAEKAAKPLESSLVKAGAVKQCDAGDPGRGPDNTEPWYSASFELGQSRENAIKTINKIAADNGYDLRHASKADKGLASGVDDKYIDNWFYASKASPYQGLEGAMELFFIVENEGPFGEGCGGKKPTKTFTGPDITGISIKVNMPTLY